MSKQKPQEQPQEQEKPPVDGPFDHLPADLKALAEEAVAKGKRVEVLGHKAIAVHH